MKKTKKTPNVKMNLTLSKEFYQMLQDKAKSDYMRVATWTKQFLMKNLLSHKTESKVTVNNETTES